MKAEQRGRGQLAESVLRAVGEGPTPQATVVERVGREAAAAGLSQPAGPVVSVVLTRLTRSGRLTREPAGRSYVYRPGPDNDLAEVLRRMIFEHGDIAIGAMRAVLAEHTAASRTSRR